MSKTKAEQPQESANMVEPPKNRRIAGITQLVKEIGRGSFGRTFLGQQINPPNYYFIVKCISIKYADNAKLLEMEKALNRVRLIESPYLVKLYYFLRTQTQLYLYKDYCDGGTLEEYLRNKNGPLSETETLIIFRQILEGYSQLIRSGHIHEDIKMENIMLHQGKIKLSEVVFTSIIDNIDFANIRLTTILSIYGSPQLHRKRLGERYTNKCDVWSVGVVIFQLLYNRPPIEQKVYMAAVENTNQTKANEPRIDFSKPMRRSNLVEDLLRKMLAYTQEQRISWHDVFRHPLFNERPCHSISISMEYSAAVVNFCKYMKLSAIRGYFRIDINDVSEVPLDTSVDIVELFQRHDKFVTIFNEMMRDRNECFFYCSILWVFYRFSDRIPHALNKNRQFEFVLLHKAFRCARKNDFTYFGRSTRPSCANTNSIWELYQKSHQYQQVKALFQQDLNLLEGLIHCVLGVIRREGIGSNRIQQIIALHNQTIETEEFFKIYTSIISQCVVFLKKVEDIQDPSRLLLEYMQISFFPKHTFVNNKFDFYKFYEEYERRFNLTLEQAFNQGAREYEGVQQRQIETSIVGGLAGLLSISRIDEVPSKVKIDSQQNPSSRLQPIVTEIRTTERRLSPIRSQTIRLPAVTVGEQFVPPQISRTPIYRPPTQSSKLPEGHPAYYP